MILAGAKWSRYIREGDWYRLIAPMFLHAGVFHLLMNMYVLVTLGRDLETAFGWWRISVYRYHLTAVSSFAFVFL
jgi:rhomboid protease GluP